MSSGHLRESGVGKIVYFYQKSPRVESRVRRKAEQLVAKWSRLVIKRSDNYRERRHETQHYNRDEVYVIFLFIILLLGIFCLINFCSFLFF